ncbi:MAG: hypothetical protein CVU84_08915 [Firmicutes bacterium HGW-Firmicutes-1]|nr:MAG: hypothetical protein CVU84_08915 [Firmicutes bacterium HGW-Firmicutes-1]
MLCGNCGKQMLDGALACSSCAEKNPFAPVREPIKPFAEVVKEAPVREPIKPFSEVAKEAPVREPIKPYSEMERQKKHQ